MGHKKKKGSVNGAQAGGPRSPSPELHVASEKEGQRGSAQETDTAGLSKFLQADSAAVQERVERIQELLGSETQLTLAQRADLVYNRRPEILELVGDLQQAYLILAKRYDHVASKVVRLAKASDSPVLDVPVLKPLSLAKRPKHSSNGDRKSGTPIEKGPPEATAAPVSPESSNLNPDAPPFVASPQLNPEAPVFTPSSPLVIPNGQSSSASNSERSNAEADVETPRMSSFRFKDAKGSGSYNVEEEGPLHAGHRYSDLLGGGEGPVHAGQATGSWVPDSVLYNAMEAPEIQEVVSLEEASIGDKSDSEARGSAPHSPQPVSAFLCAAAIQEAAGKKETPGKKAAGKKEKPPKSAPQLTLCSGLEEGPVHDGHALLTRGASTKFERELRLSRQMAEALALDQQQARECGDPDVKYILTATEDDKPVKVAVKQSLLRNMISQQATDEEKEQLETIGQQVEESGTPKQVSSGSIEHETQRLRHEVDDLIAQKKQAIRYLTECVDNIRQEKRHVATVLTQLAAENFALRAQLEEVLRSAEARGKGFGVLAGFGWDDVIAEALEYGDADLSLRSPSEAGPSSSRSSSKDEKQKARKLGGIVIKEPGSSSQMGVGEAGPSGEELSDRKGKGKAVEIEEEGMPADSGRSMLQELRTENETLRRALAAVSA